MTREQKAKEIIEKWETTPAHLSFDVGRPRLIALIAAALLEPLSDEQIEDASRQASLKSPLVDGEGVFCTAFIEGAHWAREKMGR